MNRKDLDALIEFYKEDRDAILKGFTILGLSSQLLPALMERNTELETKVADLERQLKDALERY